MQIRTRSNLSSPLSHLFEGWSRTDLGASARLRTFLNFDRLVNIALLLSFYFIGNRGRKSLAYHRDGVVYEIALARVSRAFQSDCLAIHTLSSLYISRSCSVPRCTPICLPIRTGRGASVSHADACAAWTS